MNYFRSKDNVDNYINLTGDKYDKYFVSLVRNYVNIGSRILEIGSGTGNDYNQLKKDYLITPTDFSRHFVDYIKEKHHGRDAEVLDASTSFKFDEPFDAIISNKVLQTLSYKDFKKSLQTQADNLKSGGLIIMTLWNGPENESWSNDDTLLTSYHNADTIARAIPIGTYIIARGLYKEIDEDDSIAVIFKKR